MANFQIVYDWMMDYEDSQRHCSIVPDPVPVSPNDSPGSAIVTLKRSAQAISGINSFFFPSEFQAIAAISQPQRGPLVQRFYQSHFWNTWFAQLASDDVAKRVYDSAVNQGAGSAVKFLQRACNRVPTPGSVIIATDGAWGPVTLAAANAASAADLVKRFIEARIARYEQTEPAGSAILAALIARASK